ncbi:MAG: hypothetical protein HWD59_00705 [Coxiellaceae bacterium]|nr:MAG: hypothetical protein HWD59_00705 [Coxiellaceae bacterium]
MVELFDFGGRSWEPLIDKTSVPAFVTQVKNKADAEENTASSKEVTNSNDADDNIGFYIVSLVNHTDNAHEGKVLLHCAGNYTYKCLYQSSHLLSVRDKKESRFQP